MTYTFRIAVAEDWKPIADLLRSADLPLDGAQDHLDGFVTAFDGDTLAGVAGIERYGSCGLLRSVVVRNRNAGLGRLLVQRLIQSARDNGLTCLILLTTTAADYFPRFGFIRISRDHVPDPVKASAEFQGACPTSAVVMQLTL